MSGDQRGDGEPDRHPRLHERERHLHERFDALEEAAVAAELETGRREETEQEAKRHILVRIGRIMAGSAISLAGLALLVLPGPGLVVLAMGLAILAIDVPFAARLLEKVRARIPADAEGNVSKPVVYGGLTVSFVAVCGSLWWTFFGR